jgi:hypothetical protein
MFDCKKRDRLKRELESATVDFATEDVRMQSGAFPIEDLVEQEQRVEDASRRLQEAHAALKIHVESHGCAIGGD